MSRILKKAVRPQIFRYLQKNKNLPPPPLPSWTFWLSSKSFSRLRRSFYMYHALLILSCGELRDRSFFRALAETIWYRRSDHYLITFRDWVPWKRLFFGANKLPLAYKIISGKSQLSVTDFLSLDCFKLYWCYEFNCFRFLDFLNFLNTVITFRHSF